MNELDYVECMVKRKTSPLFVFLKFVCIILAVISALGFMTGIGAIIGMIVTLAFTVFFGFMAFLCNLNSNIEYEYQYCEKEVTVDKILNKNSRKVVPGLALNRSATRCSKRPTLIVWFARRSM